MHPKKVITEPIFRVKLTRLIILRLLVIRACMHVSIKLVYSFPYYVTSTPKTKVLPNIFRFRIIKKYGLTKSGFLIKFNLFASVYNSKNDIMNKLKKLKD